LYDGIREYQQQCQVMTLLLVLYGKKIDEVVDEEYQEGKNMDLLKMKLEIIVKLLLEIIR